MSAAKSYCFYQADVWWSISPSDTTFPDGYGNSDQSYLPKTKSDHSSNEVCEKIAEAVTINTSKHDN